MSTKLERGWKPWLVVAAISTAYGLVAAPALASEDELELPSIGASIRTVTGATVDVTSGVQDRVHGNTQNLLRLTVEGPLGWDAVRVQLHGVQFFGFGTAAMGAFPMNAPARFRVYREDEAWLSSPDAFAFTYLDRANLRFSLGPLDFTVGRQAISFSKAQFWSPLDIYRPFAPWVFDRDYKPGVDAIRVSTALGETAGLDVVVALGRTLFVDPTTGAITQSGWLADLSFYGSSAMARGYISCGDVDLAVQAGKVYGGVQIGLGVAGTVAELGFHAEAAFVAAESLEWALANNPVTMVLNRDLIPTHASIVLGLDRDFGNGLSVAGEYYYNGAGNSADLGSAIRRLAAGQIVNLSEHLVGLAARYEVTPVIHASAVAITAFGNISALLSPSLQYSISNESDLLVVAFFVLGERPSGAPIVMPRSEFGSYNDGLYLEWKLYL